MADRMLAFTIQGKGGTIEEALHRAERHPGPGEQGDEIHPSAQKLIDAAEFALRAFEPAIGPGERQITISGEATNANRGTVRGQAGDYVTITVATLR